MEVDNFFRSWFWVSSVNGENEHIFTWHFDEFEEPQRRN